MTHLLKFRFCPSLGALLSASLLLSVTFGPSLSVADDDDSFDSKLNASLATVAKAIDGKTGKIAIMDFPSQEGKITGLSSYISNRATNQLINLGRDVVDRVTLEKALREQKLQQSSLMDAKTAARVGKLAGAQYLLLGNFIRLPRTLNVTIRILSVESAQFVSAQEAVVSMNGDNTELINSLQALKGTESGNVTLEAPASSAQAPAAKKSAPEKKVAGKPAAKSDDSADSNQENP